jgi:lipoprotein
MKKFLIFLIICTAATASFCSCSKKGSKSESSVTSSAERPLRVRTESKIDPDEIAKEFADILYSPNGGEKYYNFITPEQALINLKASGELENKTAHFNSNRSDMLSEASVTVSDIRSIGELSDEQLYGAEEYFSSKFNAGDVHANNGYEYKIQFEFTKTSGDNDTQTRKICVIELEEGGKIIPADADTLG